MTAVQVEPLTVEERLSALEDRLDRMQHLLAAAGKVLSASELIGER